LFALHEDLSWELDFIDAIVEQNPKNYQIYHHRQVMVEEMSKRGTANFKRELEFTEQLLSEDQKNYHVWSYRYLPQISTIADNETMAGQTFPITL
jgi:protein farnesyltransferase/geranylgeranyltransferase type-1 subunit alpha